MENNNTDKEFDMLALTNELDPNALSTTLVVNESTDDKSTSITVDNKYMLFSVILDKLLFVISNRKDKITYDKVNNKFIFDLDNGVIEYTYDNEQSHINDYSRDVQLVINKHDVGPLSEKRYILLLDYLSEIIRANQ